MSTKLHLHPHPRRQAGVTMIELIMFIVIIGIALAGIIGVMSMTTGKSADPLRRKQALMIAEGLLEEVRLAQFSFCDPTASNADTATSTATCEASTGVAGRGEAWGIEAGTSAVRPFDNVNDYVTDANTPAASFNTGGVLSDAAGRAIDVQGYSATVAIVPATVTATGIGAGNPAGSADANMLRIRITVTFAGGDPVVLDGYRARYAPRLQ